MSIFVAGLDLGMLQDYTALVVIEASGTKRMVTSEARDRETGLPYTSQRPVEMMPLAQVDVRYIERFPLEIKYSVMAQLIRQRLSKLPVPRYFVLDKTGVGVPVAEMFAEFAPIGITFVAGTSTSCIGEQDYHVPKRDLIFSAQVLLQNHTMRISNKLPHAVILERELHAFRMKISVSGHDSYEAWRERDHDDLVNALAIACWSAQLIVSVKAANDLGGSNRRQEPPIISPF